MAALVVLALSFIATAFGIYFSPDASGVFLLNLGAQIVLFLIITFVPKRYAASPFELLYYIYFIFNILRSLPLLVSNNLSVDHVFLGLIPVHHYEYGALVFFIGVVFFGIGALSFSFHKPRMIGRKFVSYLHTDRSTLYLFVFLTAILLFFIAQSSDAEGFSAKRVFVDEAGMVTRFGPLRFMLGMTTCFILYQIYYLVYSKDSKLIVSLLFITLLVVSVVISLRVWLLLAMIPIIFNVMSSRNKLLLSMVPFVLVIVLYGVSFTSLVRMKGMDRVQLSDVSIVEAFSGNTLVSANFGGFVSTALSTSVVEPFMEPLSGSSLFLDPVTQFLPRKFFPDKQEELGGRLRVYQQTANILPQKMAGGVPPGIFAEFWLNFRWFGLIFFSGILGISVRYLQDMQNRTNDARYAAFIGVLGVFLVLFGFGGHLARFVNFSVQLMIGLIAAGLVHRTYLFLAGKRPQGAHRGNRA